MKKTNYIWIALLVVGTVLILLRHNRPQPFQRESGLIFGTIYNITYQHEGSLKAEIDEQLKLFDGSLSMFNDTSTISRINQNMDIVPDTFFLRVYRRAMEISEETGGAFDITVAPLVNAWGFGFKEGTFPDSLQVDSLLQLIGYQKVGLNAEGKVEKQDPRITLDCSAIAKGYAVDVIAQLLASKGIENYMVDIGGREKTVLHRIARAWLYGVCIFLPITIVVVAIVTRGGYTHIRKTQHRLQVLIHGEGVVCRSIDTYAPQLPVRIMSLHIYLPTYIHHIVLYAFAGQ